MAGFSGRLFASIAAGVLIAAAFPGVARGQTTSCAVNGTGVNFYVGDPSCPSWSACVTAFCGAVGGGAPQSDPWACVSSATTCGALAPAASALIGCLNNAASANNNASGACGTTYAGLKGAMLNLAAGGMYQGSQLYDSCSATACELGKLPGIPFGTCNGIMAESLCMAPPMCPDDCSGRGWCNTTTWTCSCYPGYYGVGCASVVAKPAPAPKSPVYGFNESIQAAKLVMGQSLIDFKRSALFLGETYMSGNHMCADFTPATQAFLKATEALSRTNHFVYAYISYATGQGNLWGDCGCAMTNGATDCFYTLPNGTNVLFSGTNWNMPVPESTFTIDPNELYLRTIRGLTSADLNVGHWHRPYVYTAEGRVEELMTYSVPLKFDAGGNCIIAASVDILLSRAGGALQQFRAKAASEMVMLDVRDGGKFVGSSAFDFKAVPAAGGGWAIPNATGTTEPHVNTMVSDVMMQLGTLGTEGSFSKDGMWYQAATISAELLLIQRTPKINMAQAAAAMVQERFENIRKAAATVANAYMAESQTCYGAALSGNTSQFLQLTESLQLALGSQVVYAYVSMEMPGTAGKWSDCGCEHPPSDSATRNDMACYYADPSGTYHYVNGSNFNQEISNNQWTTETESYTLNIKNMTAADALTGVWQPANSWTDPTTSKTYELLTFTLPLKFDPVTGKCILAVSIDVSMGAIAMGFGSWVSSQLWAANGGGLALLSTNGNTFLAGSDMNFPRGQVVPVTTYPYTMDAANAALSQLGENGFNQTLSVTTGSALYNVFSVWPSFAVLQWTPMADSVVPMPMVTDQSLTSAHQVFSAKLADWTAAARTLSNTFVASGVTCLTQDDRTQAFLAASAAMTRAMGSAVKYVYISYATGQANLWGDCGCANAGNGAVDCYYTNAAGLMQYFIDARWNMPVPANTFTVDPNELYLRSIANMTRANMQGLWHSPYVYTAEGAPQELITFSVPISFDTNGNCVSAASIDVSFAFVQQFLQGYKAQQSSESVLIDTRNGGAFIAGSDVSGLPPQIFRPVEVPQARVADFMQTTFRQLGSSWTVSKWFWIAGMLYQSIPINDMGASFALIQRAPWTNDATVAGNAFSELQYIFMKAGMQLGMTYASEGQTCYQAAALANTSQYLQATRAMQLGFGTRVVYAYASYELPGTGGKWADCGCEHAPGTSGPNAVACYYGDLAGNYHYFNGSNFNQQISVDPWTSENEGYTQRIKNMTMMDQMQMGYWHKPEVWTDPITKVSYELLTYTYPMVFDPVTGKCILAISIDVSLGFLGAFLTMTKQGNQLYTGPMNQIILVDGRDGGLFLGASGYTLPPGTAAVPLATATTSPAINMTSAAVKSWTGFQKTLSFSLGANLINSYSVWPAWAVYQSFPYDPTYDPLSAGTEAAAPVQAPWFLQAESIDAAATAITQKFVDYIVAAKTLAEAYRSEGVVCTNPDDKLKKFLQATKAMQMAYGSAIKYAYMSYNIPGGNKWGDCGCEHMTSAVDCYYTDSSATLRAFVGADLGHPIPTNDFPVNETNQYLQAIAAMTSANAAGIWQAPDAYLDPQTGQTFQLITFSYPLKFDPATGKCILAASIDVSFGFMQSLLGMFQANPSSEILFADVRGAGGFIASSQLSATESAALAGAIHDLTHIPVARIANLVHEGDELVAAANPGMVAGAATSHGFTYQKKLVLGNWMLYQRTPATLNADMRSAALTELLRNYQTAARAIGETYVGEGVTCYNLGTQLNTTQFLANTKAWQVAFGVNASVFAYVSYEMPGTNGKWGDCGCELIAGGTTVNCFTTQLDGTYRTYSGANLQFVTSADPWTSENETYTQNIKQMTAMDLPQGVWHAPEVWTDTTTNKAYELLSYSYPLSFNATTGRCILAATIDVAMPYISNYLAQMTGAADGQMLLVDARSQLFLASNMPSWQSPLTTVPLANGTAFPSFNTQANDVAAQAGWSRSLSFESEPAAGVHALNNVKPIGTKPFGLAQQLNATDSIASSDSTPMQALKRGAASLDQKIVDFIAAAKTLAEMYTTENVTCTTGDDTTRKFLVAVKGLQEAYGRSVFYAYMSYATGQADLWGDCGCNFINLGTGGANCYYTTKDAHHQSFFGADFTRPNAAASYLVDPNQAYLNAIKGMTAAANANGMWQAPDAYYAPELSQTLELVTFSYPLKFDPVTGKCILAASIDVSFGFLNQFLQTVKPNQNSEVVLVDNRGDGWFIGSSDVTAPQWQGAIYRPTMTPVSRVNTMMATVKLGLGNTFASDFMFTDLGLQYQAIQVQSVFTLVQRSPMMNRGSVAATTIQADLGHIELAAKTLGMTYTQEGTTCWSAAAFANSTQFLQTTRALQLAYGQNMVYAYVSYRLPWSNNQWGDCGCENVAADGSVNCFYTGADGSYNAFNGTDFSRVTDTDMWTTETEVYTQNIMKMTPSDSNGVWQAPDVWTDSTSGVSYELLTFSLPLAFDSVGRCTLAISVDIKMTAFLSALQAAALPMPGAKQQLVFIDTRWGGKYITGTAEDVVTTTTIFNATATPSAQINFWMSSVQDQVGGNFANSVSVAVGYLNANINQVFPYWAVVELNDLTPPPAPLPPITMSPTGLGHNNTQWEYRLVDINDTATNVSGRFEVRPNASVPWGTVCANGWGDSDASRACRSLGYTAVGAKALFDGFDPAAEGTPVYISGIACTNSAKIFLHECTNSTPDAGCLRRDRTTTRGDAGLLCRKSFTSVAPPRANSQWEYRVALAGINATALWGTLEVRPDQWSTWGSVCDDQFNNTVAQIACSSLGVPTLMATAVTNVPESTGFTYMDDVKCGPGAMYLDECTFLDKTRENCAHSEDIGILCGGLALETPQPTPVPTMPSPTPGQPPMPYAVQLASTIAGLVGNDFNVAASTVKSGFSNFGGLFFETTNAIEYSIAQYNIAQMSPIVSEVYSVDIVNGTEDYGFVDVDDFTKGSPVVWLKNQSMPCMEAIRLDPANHRFAGSTNQTHCNYRPTERTWYRFLEANPETFVMTDALGLVGRPLAVINMGTTYVGANGHRGAYGALVYTNDISNRLADLVGSIATPGTLALVFEVRTGNVIGVSWGDEDLIDLSQYVATDTNPIVKLRSLDTIISQSSVRDAIRSLGGMAALVSEPLLPRLRNNTWAAGYFVGLRDVASPEVANFKLRALVLVPMTPAGYADALQQSLSNAFFYGVPSYAAVSQALSTGVLVTDGALAAVYAVDAVGTILGASWPASIFPQGLDTLNTSSRLQAAIAGLGGRFLLTQEQIPISIKDTYVGSDFVSVRNLWVNGASIAVRVIVLLPLAPDTVATVAATALTAQLEDAVRSLKNTFAGWTPLQAQLLQNPYMDSFAQTRRLYEPIRQTNNLLSEVYAMDNSTSPYSMVDVEARPFAGRAPIVYIQNASTTCITDVLFTPGPSVVSNVGWSFNVLNSTWCSYNPFGRKWYTDLQKYEGSWAATEASALAGSPAAVFHIGMAFNQNGVAGAFGGLVFTGDLSRILAQTVGGVAGTLALVYEVKTGNIVAVSWPDESLIDSTQFSSTDLNPTIVIKTLDTIDSNAPARRAIDSLGGGALLRQPAVPPGVANAMVEGYFVAVRDVTVGRIAGLRLRVLVLVPTTPALFAAATVDVISRQVTSAAALVQNVLADPEFNGFSQNTDAFLNRFGPLMAYKRNIYSQIVAADDSIYPYFFADITNSLSPVDNYWLVMNSSLPFRQDFKITNNVKPSQGLVLTYNRTTYNALTRYIYKDIAASPNKIVGLPAQAAASSPTAHFFIGKGYRLRNYTNPTQTISGAFAVAISTETMSELLSTRVRGQAGVDVCVFEVKTGNVLGVSWPNEALVDASPWAQQNTTGQPTVMLKNIATITGSPALATAVRELGGLATLTQHALTAALSDSIINGYYVSVRDVTAGEGDLGADVMLRAIVVQPMTPQSVANTAAARLSSDFNQAATTINALAGMWPGLAAFPSKIFIQEFYGIVSRSPVLSEMYSVDNSVNPTDPNAFWFLNVDQYDPADARVALKNSNVTCQATFALNPANGFSLTNVSTSVNCSYVPWDRWWYTRLNSATPTLAPIQDLFGVAALDFGRRLEMPSVPGFRGALGASLTTTELSAHLKSLIAGVDGGYAMIFETHTSNVVATTWQESLFVRADGSEATYNGDGVELDVQLVMKNISSIRNNAPAVRAINYLGGYTMLGQTVLPQALRDAYVLGYFVSVRDIQTPQLGGGQNLRLITLVPATPQRFAAEAVRAMNNELGSLATLIKATVTDPSFTGVPANTDDFLNRFTPFVAKNPAYEVAVADNSSLPYAFADLTSAFAPDLRKPNIWYLVKNASMPYRQDFNVTDPTNPVAGLKYWRTRESYNALQRYWWLDTVNSVNNVMVLPATAGFSTGNAFIFLGMGYRTGANVSGVFGIFGDARTLSTRLQEAVGRYADAAAIVYEVRTGAVIGVSWQQEDLVDKSTFVYGETNPTIRVKNISQVTTNAAVAAAVVAIGTAQLMMPGAVSPSLAEKYVQGQFVSVQDVNLGAPTTGEQFRVLVTVPASPLTVTSTTAAHLSADLTTLTSELAAIESLIPAAGLNAVTAQSLLGELGTVAATTPLSRTLSTYDNSGTGYTFYGVMSTPTALLGKIKNSQINCLQDVQINTTTFLFAGLAGMTDCTYNPLANNSLNTALAASNYGSVAVVTADTVARTPVVTVAYGYSYATNVRGAVVAMLDAPTLGHRLRKAMENTLGSATDAQYGARAVLFDRVSGAVVATSFNESLLNGNVPKTLSQITQPQMAQAIAYFNAAQLSAATIPLQLFDTIQSPFYLGVRDVPIAGVTGVQLRMIVVVGLMPFQTADLLAATATSALSRGLNFVQEVVLAPNFQGIPYNTDAWLNQFAPVAAAFGWMFDTICQVDTAIAPYNFVCMVYFNSSNPAAEKLGFIVDNATLTMRYDYVVTNIQNPTQGLQFYRTLPSYNATSRYFFPPLASMPFRMQGLPAQASATGGQANFYFGMGYAGPNPFNASWPSMTGMFAVASSSQRLSNYLAEMMSLVPGTVALIFELGTGAVIGTSFPQVLTDLSYYDTTHGNPVIIVRNLSHIQNNTLVQAAVSATTMATMQQWPMPSYNSDLSSANAWMEMRDLPLMMSGERLRMLFVTNMSATPPPLVATPVPNTPVPQAALLTLAVDEQPVICDQCFYNATDANSSFILRCGATQATYAYQCNSDCSTCGASSVLAVGGDFQPRPGSANVENITYQLNRFAPCGDSMAVSISVGTSCGANDPVVATAATPLDTCLLRGVDATSEMLGSSPSGYGHCVRNPGGNSSIVFYSCMGTLTCGEACSPSSTMELPLTDASGNPYACMMGAKISCKAQTQCAILKRRGGPPPPSTVTALAASEKPFVCGSCLFNATSANDSFIIDCGPTGATVRYGCTDAACANCQYSMTAALGGAPVMRPGSTEMYRASRYFACPQIFEMAQYAGTTCTGTPVFKGAIADDVCGPMESRSGANGMLDSVYGYAHCDVANPTNVSLSMYTCGSDTTCGNCEAFTLPLGSSIGGAESACFQGMTMTCRSTPTGQCLVLQQVSSTPEPATATPGGATPAPPTPVAATNQTVSYRVTLTPGTTAAEFTQRLANYLGLPADAITTTVSTTANGTVVVSFSVNGPASMVAQVQTRMTAAQNDPATRTMLGAASIEDTTPPPAEPSKTSIGVIIGCVIAGVVVLAIIGGVAVSCSGGSKGTGQSDMLSAMERDAHADYTSGSEMKPLNTSAV